MGVMAKPESPRSRPSPRPPPPPPPSPSPQKLTVVTQLTNESPNRKSPPKYYMNGDGKAHFLDQSAKEEKKHDETKGETPYDNDDGNNSNNSSSSSNNTNEPEKESPLKAASELIKSLDTAYAEINSFAIHTAKDAEDARRNAKAAAEIARRYSHRTIPKLSSPFGGSTATISIGGVSLTSPLKSPDSHHPASTRSRQFSHWDDASATTTAQDAKVATTPPPGGFNPQQKHHHHNGSNGFSSNNNKDESTYTMSAQTPPLSTNSNGGRRRRSHIKAPSSADRLAQSNADDILALSIELERSKQALQTEQQLHDDTKSALASARTKNKHMEQQLQKLLQDQERQRDAENKKMDTLEHELSRAQYRVQAAEEDAQLALDLAKQSALEREKVGTKLEEAMKEIERLKRYNAQISSGSPPRPPPPPPSGKHVRFADEPTPPRKSQQPAPPPPDASAETPPRSRAPRSMISAGRHLLRLAKADATNTDVCTIVEFTPTKSLERRRRLRQRLEHLTTNDSPSATMAGSKTIAASTPPRFSQTSEEVRNAARLLQDSGKRLELAGHWWKTKSAIQDTRLEAMTRQYCQSIESKMDQQTKEIGELGALCGYLERRLVVDKEEEEPTQNHE